MTEPHPTIRPQPGILDIALYQGGEAKLAGHARVLKLSSNENPFGPSPKALAAYRAAAASLHLYPLDRPRRPARRRSPRCTDSTRRASSAARAPTRSSPS